MIWSVLGGWMLYFYLPPQGAGVARVPAALYGGALFVIRAVNAVLAIPIGHFSDRARSRWGRRLPFMFVAALPMLVAFVLIWTPPVPGESIWNLAYLALVFAVYSLAYSLNQIPYMALLPELAPTDHHRVRVSAWASSFFLLGLIVAGLGGPIIERWGYVTMGLLYAGFALPFFYLPFLVLRERTRAAANTRRRIGLRETVRSLLRNRPFLFMTAAGVFYWGITTLVQSMMPYIVTEVCLLDTGDVFLFYIPGVAASLACYPLVTWLSKRVTKYAVFAGSLLASAVVLPGVMLIGDFWPAPLGVQGVIWITMQAIALSGVAMLPPAFGAEIVDYDETLTGERREGLYYATWGLLDQVVNGITAAALPVILMLGRSHTDPGGPLGVRLTGVVGGVLMLAAFVIFVRYPLRANAGPVVSTSNQGGVL